MPEEHIKHLVQGYNSKQNDTDGEIFRKIISSRDDSEARSYWLNELSSTKRNDVRQLIKNRRYATIFDPIRDIPGLFANIQLGQLHRLLGMGCDEVLWPVPMAIANGIRKSHVRSKRSPKYGSTISYKIWI